MYIYILYSACYIVLFIMLHCIFNAYIVYSSCFILSTSFFMISSSYYMGKYVLSNPTSTFHHSKFVFMKEEAFCLNNTYNNLFYLSLSTIDNVWQPMEQFTTYNQAVYLCKYVFESLCLVVCVWKFALKHEFTLCIYRCRCGLIPDSNFAER